MADRKSFREDIFPAWDQHERRPGIRRASSLFLKSDERTCLFIPKRKQPEPVLSLRAKEAFLVCENFSYFSLSVKADDSEERDENPYGEREKTFFRAGEEGKGRTRRVGVYSVSSRNGRKSEGEKRCVRCSVRA